MGRGTTAQVKNKTMSHNPYANMNAWFTNIDDQEFVVKWNGKDRRFAAGETKLLPAWFAEHCAKHLTNHLLLKTGNPKFENYTSPKKPSEVPEFWNRFNLCFKLQGAIDKTGEKDELDAAMEQLNTPQAEPEKPADETETEEEFEEEEETETEKEPEVEEKKPEQRNVIKKKK